jgi:hypothetical protein
LGWRSCGGSSTAPRWRGWWRQPFSLLGDDDAGENPFLLTLSWDDVIGTAGVIPFLKATSGISFACHAPAWDQWRRRSSTWCSGGRFVRTSSSFLVLLFSFFFALWKREKISSQ